MWTRGLWIVAVLAVTLKPAQAQPWAKKDAKAEALLESLLKIGVDAGGIRRSTDPKSKIVLWQVVSPAKLVASLATEKAKITDALCDTAVMRWRDDPANRAFWTAYLRALAVASQRPREAGFADLFEGVAASRDRETVKRAEEFYTRARRSFAKAKDDAWAAAVEIEIGNLALALERFKDADAAYGRAAELYSKAVGADCPLAASATMSRGNVAFRQQKYAEAVRFYSDAVKMLGADDGPNAGIIVGYLQNLAQAQIAVNNSSAAKTSAERGLAIIRKAESDESARQLPFLEVLGQIYMSRSERALARNVAARSLKLARAVYGNDSVNTVRYLTTLADRERAAGNATAAFELLQSALKILMDQPSANETEIADVRSEMGRHYMTLAKLDQAAAEYTQALDGYRRGTTRRDRIGEIFTLQQLAAVAANRGRIAESKVRYRQAIKTAEQLLGPGHPFLAGLKRAFATHLAGVGAYSEAAAELRSARNSIDKAVKTIEWADLTNNLAMMLEMADEISEAEREMNEAIEIFRREQHPHITLAYTTLASIHRKRGNYPEAARCHRLALDIQTRISGAEDDSSLILRTMAALDEQRAGRFTEAEKLCQQVADIRLKRDGPTHPLYLKALLDIADVQKRAGRLADAKANFERVLETKPASALPHQERVRTLMGLARIHEDRRDLRRARHFLDDARKLLADSGATESDLFALVLTECAEVDLKMGETKSAEVCLAETVDLHRKLKTVAREPALAAIRRLAGLRAQASDYPGALKWIEEGLGALAAGRNAEGLPWKTSSKTADLLTLKAEVLLRSDKSLPTLKAAHELLTTAGLITDRLRFRERPTTEGKAALIGDLQTEAIALNLTICESLAQAEPAANWKAAAYRAVEEGRARVFLEQLGRSRSEIAGGLPADLASREKANGLELDRLRRELEAIEGVPFDRRSPERVAELQKAIKTAEEASEKIQAIIARDHPRVAALRQPNPCSVGEARATLGSNEAAVIYCCRKKVGYAIVLQPPSAKGDGIDLVPLAGMDDLEDDLEVLSTETNLKIPDLYREKAVRLYTALITPLEKIVGDRDLLIVPDGKLGLLPFEMLIDAKGRFLIESRSIRFAPSMSALHLNGLWEKKRVRPTRTVLAIGDPITSSLDPRCKDRLLRLAADRILLRTGERFDRLTFSGHEATAAAAVFRAPKEDLLLGSDACEEQLKARSASGRLAEYRYLHFATHGILGNGSEFPPALVLSLLARPEPGPDDGFLTVVEASQLRLNADLVVLSACRSARGDLRTGEGITGLARSFLNAGCRGVVCSLWAIDDSDTVEAIVDFFSRLDRGAPEAAALREIKLRMIREGKQPFEWSPFILIGASG